MANLDPVTFYVDFSSPYAYLMARDLTHLCQRHDRELRWHPFLLGAVFKRDGNTPTVLRPERQAYTQRELARSARRKGLRFNTPPQFPFNSIDAVRAYWWLAERSPRRAQHLAAALLDAAWLDGLDLSARDVVVAVAARFDIEGAELRAALDHPETKALAHRKVDQALATGLFGAPWVTVGDEPFWGCDRLDDISHWLECGGW
ncbi:2-hydroxychromene-2-carboxylate isomerase [Litorivicinus lipolyticus]|uniref:2-hydroxychromene-2-carboxylate isomerase n=1 Tax=Litorivicinus lipolyticus TaxID=418701 RepID=UPI003B5BFE45